MKLIIDIPDEVYNDGTFLDYFHVMSGELVETIYNGTPLPKGHGRLIDADELSKRLVNASMFFRGEKADMFDTRFADGLREADIKLSEAPTVVEANKENKE